MFTGIVEETGIVKGIVNGAASMKLIIKADIVLEKTVIGDSIAVNGVCLTVTHIENKMFTADVMHETYRRTAFASLKNGDVVNLERAMRADARFGGHIVSGHIDGTGKITDIKKDDNAVWYTIETTDKIAGFIIEKGSVTIDGISLTVAAVSKNQFSVSIIPHTQKATTLGIRKKGDLVNIENDCIGKYIAKFLKYGIPDNEETTMDNQKDDSKKSNMKVSSNSSLSQGITREFLLKHEF